MAVADQAKVGGALEIAGRGGFGPMREVGSQVSRATCGEIAAPVSVCTTRYG